MSSFRLDGRHHTGIRASSCWLGILERATGSAQLELEGTKVITAVHGPLVVGGRREHPARATIEVVFKPCSGIAGPQEKHWERLMKNTLAQSIQLAKYPRACIQVIVQVIHDDGSILAAALNSAAAALMDASISMTATFAAVTVALTKDGGMLMDPQLQEEQAAVALMSTVFAVRRDSEEGLPPQVSTDGMHMCHACGLWPKETVDVALQLCQAGAIKACGVQYQAVKSAFAPL